CSKGGLVDVEQRLEDRLRQDADVEAARGGRPVRGHRAVDRVARLRYEDVQPLLPVADHPEGGTFARVRLHAAPQAVDRRAVPRLWGVVLDLVEGREAFEEV